jgi:hypothetical protein
MKHTIRTAFGDSMDSYGGAAWTMPLLLLLLTHGLVSVKLLYGLCRYALSAFVPPSVIPNLQKNSWRGQAIKQICE